MSEMDINEIKKYLPHRYPFLLVDKVLACEPGKSILAVKNVTVNEPYFTGHFPVSPVMPGVLIVEALAQTSGLLTLRTIGRYPEKHELFYLVGLDNVRFKRMVLPGDTLHLDVELIKERSGLWKFKGTAKVGEDVACTIELKIISGQ